MKTVSMLSLVATLAVANLASAQPAPAPAPPDCSAPEYRAFDFWIGEWDAYDQTDGSLAGRSSIKREDSGCVITEHWVSAGSAPDAGYSGRSLNIYDRITGQWEQDWMDSTGEVTHFVGGPIPGGMQLTDPANRRTGGPKIQPFQTRMTFTANPDGTVRQHGQASLDGGVTWLERYDYLYKPHKGD